jgi:hypothetical protein
MYTLTIGRKTVDSDREPVLARSDKYDLCKLKGDFTVPVIPDYGRLL